MTGTTESKRKRRGNADELQCEAPAQQQQLYAVIVDIPAKSIFPASRKFVNLGTSVHSDFQTTEDKEWALDRIQHLSAIHSHCTYTLVIVTPAL